MHFMQSMDKFQAIELQQHGPLQLSPGAWVVLNWPTASIQRAATSVSGLLAAARESTRTVTVAGLSQALICPAGALAYN
jgi:hypothetical protein